MIGERSLDGLLDPPGGVSRKLGAFGRVEALDAFHQTDIALVDEVEQWQAQPVVIAGDLHHQPQVGLDHVLSRLLVAFFDALSQGNLFGGGQQFHLPDLAQIELQGRELVGFAGTGLCAIRFRRCHFTFDGRRYWLLLFPFHRLGGLFGFSSSVLFRFPIGHLRLAIPRLTI